MKKILFASIVASALGMLSCNENSKKTGEDTSTKNVILGGVHTPPTYNPSIKQSEDTTGTTTPETSKLAYEYSRIKYVCMTSGYIEDDPLITGKKAFTYIHDSTAAEYRQSDSSLIVIQKFKGGKYTCVYLPRDLAVKTLSGRFSKNVIKTSTISSETESASIESIHDTSVTWSVLRSVQDELIAHKKIN